MPSGRWVSPPRPPAVAGFAWLRALSAFVSCCPALPLRSGSQGRALDENRLASGRTDVSHTRIYRTAHALPPEYMVCFLRNLSPALLLETVQGFDPHLSSEGECGLEPHVAGTGQSLLGTGQPLGIS